MFGAGRVGPSRCEPDVLNAFERHLRSKVHGNYKAFYVPALGESERIWRIISFGIEYFCRIILCMDGYGQEL
jgi:hypothetical protein